jgi:hypothetical protein
MPQVRLDAPQTGDPEQAGSKRRKTVFLLLLPGILFLVALASTQSDRILSGRNDFMQLWVGARLVGTPDLYSIEANKALQVKTVGVWLEAVYHSRPPFYSFLLKPLGHMPYLTAYAVFQLISFACFAGFLRLYLPQMPELALYCSLSLPLLSNFAQGQDLTLVLLLAGVSLALLRQGKDLPAGLILSLCAIKFHLFLLIPLILVVRRRWTAIAGGALGGAGLFALSFLGARGPWIEPYLRMLRNPELSPGAEHMPNLHGLLFAIGAPTPALEVLLAIAVAAAVAWIAWKSKDVETAFAFALLGGMLNSYHAYLQDCALLLLAFPILARSTHSQAVRHLNAIIPLPPLYLLLLAGKPYNAVCAASLLAILVAGTLAASKQIGTEVHPAA